MTVLRHFAPVGHSTKGQSTNTRQDHILRQAPQTKCCMALSRPAQCHASTGFYERPLQVSQWHMLPVAWQAAGRHGAFIYTHSRQRAFWSCPPCAAPRKGQDQDARCASRWPASRFCRFCMSHNDKFGSPTLQPGPVPMLRLKALGVPPRQLPHRLCKALQTKTTLDGPPPSWMGHLRVEWTASGSACPVSNQAAE